MAVVERVFIPIRVAGHKENVQENQVECDLFRELFRFGPFYLNKFLLVGLSLVVG